MIYGSIVLMLLSAWLELKMPEYMAEITTLVQTEGSAMSAVWRAGGMMLLCAFLSMVTSMLTGFLCAKIAAGYSMRLRDEVFCRTQSFSFEELNRFSIASLITRSTNDVTQVQSLISMGLSMIIKSPLMAILAIIKISAKQWQWTLTAWICVGLMLLLNVVTFIFAEPKFKIMQELTDNLNRVTREHLTGLRVVRAYNAESWQEAKFEEANERLTRTGLFTGRLMAVMNPGMMLIMEGMNLAIYWVGAVLISKAGVELRVGLFADMVVFSSYAMQVVMSFMMLVFIFIMAPRAVVSANRILEVIETEPKITDGPGAVQSAPAGSIEFRNVSFRYPGAADDVLRDISFRADPGETVAIIGSTGSGKTTLVNLIMRFYDVTGGSILVDGADVRDYVQEDLRGRMGFVPQKAVLFSGTVMSNVTGADVPADKNDSIPAEEREKVREAIRIAQGIEFVESLSGGYHGSVSQGGSNFSGGQKQRLSIARAVYRRPEILIFDDSFSALDYRTDRTLRSELRNTTKGTTCLIVAQRIGTIMDADRIIVLDQGRVDGIGTHSELLKSSPVYRQIALSQLSEEELQDV